MHAESSSAAPDFWPGYVDALINVVLNLLFVVSIFGIAVAATSIPTPEREASAEGATALGEPDARAVEIAPPSPVAERQAPAKLVKGSSPDQREGPSPAIAADPGLAPSDPVLDLRLNVHSGGERQETAAVRVDQVSPGKAEAADAVRVKITFASGAVALDDEARRQLRALAVSSLADRPLTLWMATDLRQSTARLAASQRLIALRDELTGAGVEADRIDLRVTGGGTWPESNGATVWLSSVGQGSSQ